MWKGKIIHSLLLRINFKLICRLEIVFNDLPSSETMTKYAAICDIGHFIPINSIRYADTDLNGTQHASSNLSVTRYSMGEGVYPQLLVFEEIIKIYKCVKGDIGRREAEVNITFTRQ